MAACQRCLGTGRQAFVGRSLRCQACHGTGRALDATARSEGEERA